MATPTLSRADMAGIALEYHERFGLKNRAAVRQAVLTLQHVGYRDDEILDMYAVLSRKPARSIAELVGAA
jgi:hypothetical protein